MLHALDRLSDSCTKMSARGACGINFRKRIQRNSCACLVASHFVVDVRADFSTLIGPFYRNSRYGTYVAGLSSFGIVR